MTSYGGTSRPSDRGRLRIADRRVVSRETPLMGPADCESTHSPSSRPRVDRASPRPAFPDPRPWTGRRTASRSRSEETSDSRGRTCPVSFTKGAELSHPRRRARYRGPRRRRSREGGRMPVSTRDDAARPRLQWGQGGRKGKSEAHAASFPTASLLTSPASGSTPGGPGDASRSPSPPPVPGCGLQPRRCVARPGASHAESDVAVGAGARRPAPAASDAATTLRCST